MAKDNVNNLKEKINFLKFMGLKIDIYYSINSPNIIIKEQNNILQFNTQKEMNWHLNKLIKEAREQLEKDLLNEKGIFKNE